MRVHIVPALGRVRLQELKPAAINRIYADLLRSGLSAKTVRNAHIALRKALADALDSDLVHANPAARAKPPKPERPKLVVPDADGVMRLIEAARGTRFELLIIVAAGTGLRRGELLGLSWTALDLDRARARIVQALTRLPGGSRMAQPKTDRGRREIALPAFAVAALRRQRVEQNQRRLILGDAWHDDGLVFDRGDGAPIDPDGFSHWFRKTAARIGCGCMICGTRTRRACWSKA